VTVVLNGRDEVRLERSRRELEDESGRAAYGLAFGVTDSAAVAPGVAQAVDLVGGLDILINKTGTQHRAPTTGFGDEDRHRLVATNGTNAFHVRREVPTWCRAAAEDRHDLCSASSLLARRGIAPYAARPFIG